MADVNSNININFNTAAALAQLRSLQAGLSRFHQSLAEGNLAASNAQKGLNAQLLQSIGATGKFSASQVKVAGSTLAFTSALEKNKLSLREYYRYTMAAATANTRVMGKAFAQEREIINRARRDRVKALQAQYIQMNKSNSGFMDAIKVMPKSLAMANGKFTELGTRIQYAAQRQQFLNQLLKQGSTQLLNFGKNTQWAGRQLMVGLTMPLALFGSMAAKTFRELETEIVKFKRVYGDAFTNDVETDAAVANIRRLATEYTKYGVSVTKTVEMAATAAAAGFTGSALNAQVETATKLAVLGQIEQQQALETTISLQSAFGISSEELAKKIDFLNAVENQTLLSIEDLTIAIPKAAPVVKQLGGTVEDLAFFLTAMKEGGINASEGANALKSGLASLINPSDKAAKFMGALGINIKGLVEANKGDIKATVVGFARALDELDPLNRARAIEQMFGKFQFSRLSTLFQNVTKDGSQASRAFDLAGKSVEELAIISEREMKKIEDSVGTQFQAAVEKFKQDIMPLGKIFLEALTPVVKFFGDIFEKFNGLSDSTKKVIAIIVGAVAGLGPIVLMTFGLLANGIANVIKFFSMLRGGIARLNGQTSVMGAGFNYMTQEQIENAASSQQLHQTHTRLIEVFNVEAGSVNALASSYSSLSTQMRAMASQNPALFAGGMGGAKRAVAKIPTTRKYKDGIISVPGPKGAGDVVPAMLSPGEAVIPTETTDKYRGLITAMFQDKVPGFMAGRIPKGPVIPHGERQSGAVFVGMPISAAKAAQSRQILDKISDGVKLGKYGSVPPTDFGTKLKSFKGFSFPERGVGGVYRKPNGEVVVVKPTIDEKTALAEERMTTITRKVHEGLIAPKQTIKTMIDPTDPTGQRKFIVLESPYDPRIAAMSGKFSKSDMVKQLVASTLRGDKDLQKANVSGNIVADVGNAGVFDRASGFRDFAKTMPSMEQQAMVNLLGVKGGARKDFAQATSSFAAGMTPAQYDAAIKAEINRSIPRLEKLLKSWDKNLDPTEKIVYANMLERLKAGKNADWASLQPIHARAGQGVKKAIDGIDPKAPNSILEQQLAKYTLPQGSQADLLVNDLKRNAESEFIKKLNTIDPKRKAVIEAAWYGGKANVPPSGTEKAFNTPRQTSFLDEISKMVPVRVGNEIKYVHKSDYDAFKADPDGRARYARTQAQITENLLYRMGVTPDNKGRLVAGGGFEGRFGAPSHFVTDLKSTGKAAGGGLGVLSDVVRPEARKLLDEYNKRMANSLNSSAANEMRALGLSDQQILKKLSPELSHLVGKTGIGGRDAAKFKTGLAQYDTNALNRYIGQGSTRISKILEWNNKGGANPLNLDKALLSEYEKAGKFMATGLHPETPEQRALIARAAELESKAADYKAAGGKISGVTLGKNSGINAKALLAILKDPSIKPSRVIDLGATTQAGVLVGAKPGEILVDQANRTKTKLTNKNTSPLPSNVIPINRKGKVAADTRTIVEKQGQSVLTAAQSSKVRFIPGREDGVPGAKMTPYQRQELKKISTKYPTLDESQLKKILQRKLKADKALLDAKERELAIAKKAERRAEQLPKQEAARQAKLDKIENQRQSRLLEASRYQDKANKMNAKMDRQKNTKQARIARQEKVGRFSGGTSMALGTAGMGLMMAGQQNAGMAVMGASAVAGMAPMLTNPYVAAAAAVAALVGGLWMLDRSAKKAAEAQSKMVDSTYATTEKMKIIGELTGNVGASEIMSKRRSTSVSNRYTTGFERGKQQFGATFLENAAGKDIMAQFIENMKSGTDTAARQMALQLGGYISDGVMSAEQAHSVASQIGINLSNQTLTSQISGQLLELVGPSGEDLLISPLEVRVRLVEEQRDIAKQARTQFADRMKQDVNPASMDNTLGFLGTYSGLGGVVTNQIMSGSAEGQGYNFKEAFTQTTSEKLAASTAAMGVQDLEFNQSQIDSLTVQYEKELKILEAKKAGTTDAVKRKAIDDQISKIEEKRLSGVKTLRQNNKEILEGQLAAFQIAKQRAATEASFFDSLKNQVKMKAESQGQGAFADTFLEKAAALDSKDLEVKINTIVASGQMPTATATGLLDMFAGKETELDAFINATTNLQDPGKISELINSLNMLENKETAKNILVEIGSKDPKEADKLMSTIALMQKMSGKEINITTFFSQEDALGKLAALQTELEAIETMPTPITKEAIALINTDGNSETQDMGALLKLWDKWGNLDNETKKTVIQEYITLLRTITEGDVDAAIAAEVAANPSSARSIETKYNNPEAREAKRAEIAADRVMQAVKQDQASKKAGQSKGESKGKGNNPLAFLDSLAMGLKQVRDNAFNALKPVDSLLAAFRDKKTQQGAFALFDGIQNRLLKLGAGEGLRGAIESMSAEDFSKVAALKGNKALFTFAKGKPRSKDTITGLTETGKAVDQGYKERDMGNFKLANDVTIAGIKEQTKAYNMLISGGLSASEALDVVADKSQAAAIAAGTIKKGTPEWKKYIAAIKESNTALERQAVLNKMIRANEDFEMYKKMPKLASDMKSLGYSTDQIDAVLSDPDLAKQLVTDLKDGKGVASSIATFLNNIEGKKTVDIQTNLNKGDLAAAAEPGRQIIDELFAAQEGIIRTGKEAMEISANDKLISGYELQIAPFARSIELLNDQIEDGQRAIEENYSRPIEALSEEVNDLTRSLEMNPLFGDRAIQTIQDENSRLSNDLAVISNAAEEVNKRYDDQAEALQKVSDINQNILDQQKQQISLADAITSGDISAAARAVQEMRAGNASRFAEAQSKALQQARENALGSLVNKDGENEEKINKKQYENSQRIYAMENDPSRLKIISDIRTKQDAIYVLEEGREAKLADILKLEDKIFELEEKSIEPTQENIDALVYQNTLKQGIIDKAIAELKVRGRTREEWDRVNAEIDYFAAAKKAADNPNALAGLITAADTLKTKWDEILKKVSGYLTIVPAGWSSLVSVGGSSTGGSSTGGSGTGGSGTGGSVTVDAAKSAADEKFKQDAIKRTQGFNTPIGDIERSLAGYGAAGYASSPGTVTATSTQGTSGTGKPSVSASGTNINVNVQSPAKEITTAMDVANAKDAARQRDFYGVLGNNAQTSTNITVAMAEHQEKVAEEMNLQNKEALRLVKLAEATSKTSAEVVNTVSLRVAEYAAAIAEGMQMAGKDRLGQVKQEEAPFIAHLIDQSIQTGKEEGRAEDRTATAEIIAAKTAEVTVAAAMKTSASQDAAAGARGASNAIYWQTAAEEQARALAREKGFAEDRKQTNLLPAMKTSLSQDAAAAARALANEKAKAEAAAANKAAIPAAMKTSLSQDFAAAARAEANRIEAQRLAAEKAKGIEAAAARDRLKAIANAQSPLSLGVASGKSTFQLKYGSKGGLVPRYFASGGYARGTDTVPSMLTPGEFVMSKYAVDKYGVENMQSINSGSSIGDSVYNYNLNLNVKSDANPDDIARAVMVQIKGVDAQRIRGARF